MPRLNEKDAARRAAVGHGSYFVESLARGLSVIQAFGRDRSAMTLSDMARATGLPKPTVRRVLHTLTDVGYVETDGRVFRLTPKVMTLAMAYLGSDMVATVLQPACERVMAMTGESCFAGILDGDDMMMIAHANRRFPLGLVPSIGLRMPALFTAAGRVMLGMLPDGELDKRLKKASLQGNTQFTVTDKKALRAAILQARKDGFCMTKQEADLGYCAIAVPLRRSDGTAVGAFSIPARAERCAAEPDLMASLLAILREEVDKFAEQLI